MEFLFLLDNVLVWEYRANVHLLQCWHWSRSKRHSAGFLFTFKHNLHILDMSGTVSSRQVPHMRQACYSGPEMCKPGSSKTYTNPLPTTGLSQAVFCTNAAPNAFLTSATPHSPPRACARFWPMTRDRCSQLIHSDMPSGVRPLGWDN